MALVTETKNTPAVRKEQSEAILLTLKTRVGELAALTGDADYVKSYAESALLLVDVLNQIDAHLRTLDSDRI